MLRKEVGYSGCLVFFSVGAWKPPKLGNICSSKIDTRAVKSDAKVREGQAGLQNSLFAAMISDE